MNALIVAVAAGLLMAGGVYLLTERHPFRRILGFSCMGHAVNVTLFEAGGVQGNPAFIDGTDITTMASPIPQSLVLTAVVIGLALVTLLAVTAFRQEHH